ncbi:MAG: biopolymer transporter ExbD [Xanthomonadaceae bacterium]|jgi:biopolymer transport protein ExbD|nr:biopolymer transporter ExbD [Xanthomonadaceae bacterium]
MKIAPNAGEDEFEINVIPLIDVMLVLLMFLVLTTTFHNTTRVKITLPEASATAASTDGQELVVMIDRDARFYVGPNEVLNPSLETLKEALAQAAGNNRGQRVVLRADGRTPHQAVVTAMDALAQLGFANLQIATVPAEAGN